MNRRRVLQLVPDFGPGGGERVALALAEHLDASRYTVATLRLFDAVDPALEDRIHALDGPAFHLGKHRGPDLRMFARIDRTLADFRPDVVHTHRYGLRYALPAMLRRRVPVRVHTVHNLATKEVGAADRLVYRFAFRRGVVPVAIAEAVAESLRAVYGPADYPVIPNGIALGRLGKPRTARQAWRAENGWDANALLFAGVGRLERQKNWPLLLDAFAPVAAAHPSAHLLLAGDGPLRDALEARLRILGLTGRVHLLGFRDDIPSLLHAADVFAASSDWEGHPLSVIEAMAAGLPVVSTAAGGVPEMVVAGETGHVVPLGDRAALTEALRALAGDAERRKQMGTAAVRRAEALYSVEAMVRRYEGLYERLWTRHHTTAHAPGGVG